MEAASGGCGKRNQTFLVIFQRDGPFDKKITPCLLPPALEMNFFSCPVPPHFHGSTVKRGRVDITVEAGPSASGNSGEKLNAG